MAALLVGDFFTQHISSQRLKPHLANNDLPTSSPAAAIGLIPVFPWLEIPSPEPAHRKRKHLESAMAGTCADAITTARELHQTFSFDISSFVSMAAIIFVMLNAF